MIAHFISGDTIVPDPSSIKGYDRYAYSNNNPIKYFDPSGHRVTECSPGEDCGGQTLVGPGGLAENAQQQAYLAYDPTGEKQEANEQIAEMILYNGTEFFLTTFAPPIGLFYQVVSDKKITGMDLAFGLIPFGMIDDLIKNIRYLDDVGKATREFESFAEFKKVMGSAGEGKQWHHIVEQIQVSKSGFSEQMINSTNNIMSIDKAIHQRISGLYSSIQPYSGGLRVRDWLVGKSISEQYNFGINVLNDFHILK